MCQCVVTSDVYCFCFYVKYAMDIEHRFFSSSTFCKHNNPSKIEKHYTNQLVITIKTPKKLETLLTKLLCTKIMRLFYEFTIYSFHFQTRWRRLISLSQTLKRTQNTNKQRWLPQKYMFFHTKKWKVFCVFHKI